MSEARVSDAGLPAGSMAVGTAAMRDGRPVVIVLLPTGMLLPVIVGRKEA